ncbi:MAG: hypothetical protein ACI4FV_01730 [Lachnospiraceae bacterium]
MSLSVKLNQIKPDYTSVITNSTAKATDMASLSNTILTGNSEGTSLLGSSDMSSLTKTMLGSGTGSSTLSDYAAIKNGSYGKLLKAYYKEKEAEKDSEKAPKKESEKASTLSDSLSSVIDEKI